MNPPAERRSVRYAGFAFMALLLWACESAGAEWKHVVIADHGGDPSPISIDPATIRQQGKLRKAWFLTVYVKEQVTVDTGKQYRSTKALWFFDCKERSAGLKHATYYSDLQANQVVDSVDEENVKLHDIVPDSVAEDMLATVCAAKVGRTVR